jgi:hypothetical protein
MKKHRVPVLIAALAMMLPVSGAVKKTHGGPGVRGEGPANLHAVLWRGPDDIPSRNLYWGPGGEAHQPAGPFTFLKEDLDGSNPKFTVRDGAGVTWKVKLGEEARPETAASRLVWAVGYFANENYYLPEMTVLNLGKLRRGGRYVERGGLVRGARLKREPEGARKAGSWSWNHSVFAGTRELNGLIVMMALVNNWDLKDVNNSVIEEKGTQPERVYLVSDLGATFGGPRFTRPIRKSRGNLKEYSRSKFIRKTTVSAVDFAIPAWPGAILMVNPVQYFRRVGMRHIGRDVPVEDVRWIAGLLARLTPAQIEDAFRAAGYGPGEIEGFSRIVEERIDVLNSL